MKIFFKNLFKNYPSLDWIQIEVSSFCDGKCIYCPHTEYNANWQSRFLPIGLYKRLIPAFEKTKLVYLQGWGEPFTHPQFIDFLKIAKNAGCMVGTTTNGTMLDSDKIKELIDEGIDIIGFSLAGIDKKNDSIRKGTSIRKVLKVIEDIHRIKNSMGVKNPRIHIAYMLLRSGLNEIDKLQAFLGNIGVDQTVVSSLSFVVNESMNNEVLSVETGFKPNVVDLKNMSLKNVPPLVGWIKGGGERSIKYDDSIYHPHPTSPIKGEESDSELNSTLLGFRSVSMTSDIAYNIVSPHMKESRCSENVERALVIGSDGSVSPCVTGVIPAVGENYYLFRGERKRLERMSFGNISDDTLNSIWYSKEYKDFIRSHRRRDYQSICQSCNKRFIMDF